MLQILIPTDFEEHSYEAVAYAYGLSKSRQVNIILLNSFEDPFVSGNDDSENLYDDGEITNDLLQKLESDATSGMEVFVQKIKKRLGDQGNVSIQTRVMRGLTEDAIQDFEDANDLDLIIFGIQQEESFMKKLFGRISNTIIDNARVPVLVIPDSTSGLQTDNVAFIVDTQVRLTMLFKSFLHVYPKEDYTFYLCGHPQETIGPEEAKAALAEEAHGKINFAFGDVKHSSKAIAQYLREHSIDLLVCRNEKVEGFESIFKSSITEKLMDLAECPILILPEADKATQRGD